MTGNRIGLVLAGVVAAFAIAVPWMAGPYVVSLVSHGLTVAVVALSAQLLTEVAAQPSLGQGLFAGVGAYAAAAVANAGGPHAGVQIVAALAVSAIAGLAAAMLLCRLRDMTFLLATLALAELGFAAAETSGSVAVQRVPAIVLVPGGAGVTSDGYLYLHALGCFAAALAMAAVARRSRLGTRLVVLGENEKRLATAGISGNATLLAGVVAAAMIAGIAGHMLVATRRFVSPGDVGFELSALALIAAVIGGRSMLVCAVAAVVLVLVRDLAGNAAGGYGPALIGTVFVAVAVVRGRMNGRRHG